MSTSVLLFGIVLPWLVVSLFVALGCWLGFQLVHQNGRLLTRMEALDQRLSQMSMAPALAPALSARPAR